MSYLFNVTPISQSIKAICDQRSISVSNRDWWVLRCTVWVYMQVSSTTSIVKMAQMFEGIRDERYESPLISWDRFTQLTTPICLVSLVFLTLITAISGVGIIGLIHSSVHWNNIGSILGAVQGMGVCVVFWFIVRLADLQGVPRRIRRSLLDQHDVPTTFFD